MTDVTGIKTLDGVKFLFHTDVYKLGHIAMYPSGITNVFSNYTNRSSRIEGIDKVVHFGLTGFLNDLYREYFDFLAADINKVVEYYEKTVQNIIGVKPETQHIRNLYSYGRANQGKLPLQFASLPEGTEVPLRVPSFIFWNDDTEFAWLTNYIETWLSASVWHPSTVATKALHFRRLLNKYALETTGSIEGVGFQGHDFSYRGLTGTQAAGASGAAHLLVFDGSDNLEALNYIPQVYEEYPSETFLMGSVLASEHSVMCAGSAVDGEFETYKRLLTDNPTGIISLVSDTYDLWNVITNFLPKLKDLIEGRDGKLVIRPDSGDPVEIITGRKNFEDAYTPEEKGVVELLWDIFGGTVNEQGYKVLSDKIGTIYGDSITYERAEAIMDRLKAKGFASTNVVFGVGSYTYQYVTRDTFGSAVKATAAIIDEKDYPMFKDPVTDNGSKRSAKGFLKVYRDETGELALQDGLTSDEFVDSLADGSNLLSWQNAATRTFSEIRDRVREAF
jgi:nicotinamide phosphoribosyltransferase